MFKPLCFRQLLIYLAALLAGGFLCDLTSTPVNAREEGPEVAVLRLRFAKKDVRQVLLELYPSEAPVTVANFKKLANRRFYDKTAVHRVFPHLMVQMGDPLSQNRDAAGIGTGGPGYTLPPEIRRRPVVGAVCAARLPDPLNPSRRSNGSQFFIILRPYAELGGPYTVFGRVVGGMEVLDALSVLATDTNDTPVERVVIESVRVLPREKVAVGTKN